MTCLFEIGMHFCIHAAYMLGRQLKNYAWPMLRNATCYIQINARWLMWGQNPVFDAGARRRQDQESQVLPTHNRMWHSLRQEQRPRTPVPPFIVACYSHFTPVRTKVLSRDFVQVVHRYGHRLITLVSNKGAESRQAS